MARMISTAAANGWKRSVARQAGRRILPGLIGLLGIEPSAFAQNPNARTDNMSDDELRVLRAGEEARLRERTRDVRPVADANGTTYHEIFYCSIYYTPKESGFSAARGFDVTPVPAKGLGGRRYARDFLRAVKREGFGRLSEPVNGRKYIHWTADGYRFAEIPAGRGGERLIPRRSCAISVHNRFLQQHQRLTIKSEPVNGELGGGDFVVCDTGVGLHPLQIDLYWGEDEPRGPVGRHCARPAGTWMEYVFHVDVTVKH